MAYRDILAELESIVSDTIEAADSHPYSDEGLEILREGWSEAVEFAREKLGGRFADDVRDLLYELEKAADRIKEKAVKLEQLQAEFVADCPHCERSPCQCDDSADEMVPWESHSILWSDDEDPSG